MTNAVVRVLMLVLVAAAAYGPARHYAQVGERSASILEVDLSPEPTGSRSPVRWVAGVVDTSPRSEELGLAARPEPAATAVTPAAARRRSTVPGTVTVAGPPAGVASRGVGAVVTEEDVDRLAALDEPLRTDVVRFLTASDQAALSVVALGGPPTERGDVVLDGESPADRTRILDSDPTVRDLLRVWATQRPDLTAVVPGRRAHGRSPASSAREDLDRPRRAARGSATRTAVIERVVRRELFPALDRGRPPIAAALLTGRSAAGLFELSTRTGWLTARGSAYAVAARAVQPGSRMMPVSAPGTLEARAFARPGGGAAVLIWNPEGNRRVTLQLPGDDRFYRFTTTVAAGSLSSVVLMPR